jgi:predicted transcriptional regulator
MEIYRGNDISKGNTPQVAAWHLPSEPWIFVIDRTGKVSSSFEGALSVGELSRAVGRVRGA